jgi:signal transduction histidine kinase
MVIASTKPITRYGDGKLSPSARATGWIDTRTADGTSWLTVANTGPVLSPADADRIFQPFQRLDDRASHDGSGLGLTIVASIASIHGGTATADPRKDGGLSVTVRIPSLAARS